MESKNQNLQVEDRFDNEDEKPLENLQVEDSFDNEDHEKALENSQVEDSFDNEECEKKSEPESHNKPSMHTKDQEESFERTWSEDQEISILNIAIKFSSQNGLDPATHKTDFFGFMKESNQFDGEFSKYEVAKKLKGMKKKFTSNLVKGKTISSPHESKIFELCEKIWSDEGRTHISMDEISIISEKHVGLGENIVKEAMKHIGESRRVEFMQQWKEIKALELEISRKKAALVEYQIKAMLEANKSSKQ